MKLLIIAMCQLMTIQIHIRILPCMEHRLEALRTAGSILLADCIQVILMIISMGRTTIMFLSGFEATFGITVLRETILE